MTRPRHVGLPWYRPEDYARLRDLLADGSRMPAAYVTWQMSAEQIEREIVRSGVAVARVLIEPEAFAAWCVRHGSALDGAARSRFAAEAIERTREADVAPS